MTLLKLLEIANKGYPDGFLANYYDRNTGKPKKGSGDGLARFVVVEIAETFEPDAKDYDQIKTAERCIVEAVSQLNAVTHALDIERLRCLGKMGRLAKGVKHDGRLHQL